MSYTIVLYSKLSLTRSIPDKGVKNVININLNQTSIGFLFVKCIKNQVNKNVGVLQIFDV